MYFSKFWPPVRIFSKTYWKTPHCVVISNCRFVLFPIWKSTPFQIPLFSIIKQWIVRIKCMNRRKTSSSLGNMSGSGVQIGFDLQHYGFPPGCLVPALWFAPWSFPRFASCTIFSGMVYSLFLSEFCRPCLFYLLLICETYWTLLGAEINPPRLHFRETVQQSCTWMFHIQT